jgi:Ohr subfamily peroxiredoxin
MSDVIYTTEAHVTGGRRNGHGETSDGSLSVDLEAPGAGGAATNPEQLFAVGYAACFMSAVAFQAQREKADAKDAVTDARVSLLKDQDGMFDLVVELHVTLPALDASAAADLVRAAHTMCPYSRATRGNIDLTLTANGQLA